MAETREKERVGAGLAWLHQRLHGEYPCNKMSVKIVMDVPDLYTGGLISSAISPVSTICNMLPIRRYDVLII